MNELNQFDNRTKKRVVELLYSFFLPTFYQSLAVNTKGRKKGLSDSINYLYNNLSNIRSYQEYKKIILKAFEGLSPSDAAALNAVLNAPSKPTSVVTSKYDKYVKQRVLENNFNPQVFAKTYFPILVCSEITDVRYLVCSSNGAVVIDEYNRVMVSDEYEQLCANVNVSKLYGKVLMFQDRDGVYDFFDYTSLKTFIDFSKFGKKLSTRLETLSDLLGYVNDDRIKLIDYKLINSIQELNEHYWDNGCRPITTRRLGSTFKYDKPLTHYYQKYRLIFNVVDFVDGKLELETQDRGYTTLVDYYDDRNLIGETVSVDVNGVCNGLLINPCNFQIKKTDRAMMTEDLPDKSKKELDLLDSQCRMVEKLENHRSLHADLMSVLKL